MKLYFSPLACSMATRIALYEFGVEAEYVQVNTKKKLTEAGEDFRTINSLGLVPVLVTDESEVLTENAAVLQYVAEMHGPPEVQRGVFARALLRQYRVHRMHIRDTILWANRVQQWHREYLIFLLRLCNCVLP